VRFIYLHPPNWYLTIDLEDRRDVIERPIRNSIDLSGWDIRKSLKLFRKSNPPLFEWLQCPLIYRQRYSFGARLRALLPTFYSPRSSFFHYLHVARGNFREYLRGDCVWRKKYFYVLRPLLALRWIEQGRGPVPIEFSRLVEIVVPGPDVRDAIQDLIATKTAGAELDYGPRIPVLGEFIESEIARLENTVEEKSEVPSGTEVLNLLFRDTLDEVWHSSLPAQEVDV